MRHWRHHLATFCLVVGVAFSFIFLATAQAAPPRQEPTDKPPAGDGVEQLSPVTQDPRPDDGDGGSDEGGDSGGSSRGSSGPDEVRCASVTGEVFNWGVGPISGVSPRLSSGSWEVSASTGGDGRYAMGGLGVGVATLQVVLPPELGGQLQPFVQNAGIHLNCDYNVVANIALYPGGSVEPPVTLDVSGPANVNPENAVPVKVTVQNNLPNDITNVIVTSLMPAHLTALSVESAVADESNLKVIDGGPDGQLVTAFLDRLASGDETNLFIMVTSAEEAVEGDSGDLTATLFYAESTAVQDTLTMTVGVGSAPAPEIEPEPLTATAAEPTAEPEAAPVTEAEAPAQPTPAAEPTAAVEEESGVEGFVPPDDLPKTGEPEILAPDMLPVTGLPETLTPGLLPLSGLGLTILALLFFSVRAVRQRQD